MLDPGPPPVVWKIQVCHKAMGMPNFHSLEASSLAFVDPWKSTATPPKHPSRVLVWL